MEAARRVLKKRTVEFAGLIEKGNRDGAKEDVVLRSLINNLYLTSRSFDGKIFVEKRRDDFIMNRLALAFELGIANGVVLTFTKKD